MFRRIGRLGRLFRKDVRVLWLSFSDPQTPLWIKCCALLLIFYALSSIDLIPDVFPVVGWLDDMLILPVGISLLVRRLPLSVKKRCYARSKVLTTGMVLMPGVAIMMVILLWIIISELQL